jgi:hypothetical protein
MSEVIRHRPLTMTQELVSHIPLIIIRPPGMGIMPPKMGVRVQPTVQRPLRIRTGVVVMVAAVVRALMPYLAATTGTVRMPTATTMVAWVVTHRRRTSLAHVVQLLLWEWRIYLFPRPFKIH